MEPAYSTLQAMPPPRAFLRQGNRRSSVADHLEPRIILVSGKYIGITSLAPMSKASGEKHPCPAFPRLSQYQKSSVAAAFELDRRNPVSAESRPALQETASSRRQFSVISAVWDSPLPRKSIKPFIIPLTLGILAGSVCGAIKRQRGNFLENGSGRVMLIWFYDSRRAWHLPDASPIPPPLFNLNPFEGVLLPDSRWHGRRSSWAACSSW